MTTTTPWRNIVTPHENIKQGKVRQSDFAASLADVLHQTGNPDYYDPINFFNRTYLTTGLRTLANEVVGRLTGQGDGDAVMQIQTPFGGGKTHTLITLYHLVKNGKTCFEHPALSAYWLERGWQVPPSVPVSAFDGNHVGVGAVQLDAATAAQTMWGHIAWQLAGRSGYDLVANYDSDRITPGGEEIDKLLKLSGGGLIILDEVVNYIEKSAGIAVQDSTLAAQTLTFLQILSRRIGGHDRCALAATLPKSRLELHGTASVDALDRLQKIFGSVQHVREPVEGDEVHEIIKRRLFVPLGEDTEDKGTRTKKSNNRDSTITAYLNDMKERPQIPDYAKDFNYRKRLEQSYPFHPSLLDILNRHLGTNSKFQRTRGVLRFLALVVADLLKKNHKGGLIHASDIDLNNEEIRSELLELVDREFRSAIEADIVGAASNSSQLDKQSPQMTQWQITSGIATTAFLYTCEAGNASRGATLGELHLASARPEIDFGTIPGVVLQMKERFHFINTDGDRYRFSTTPNLNRILLDAKNGVDDEQIRERIEAELRGLLASNPLSPYIWPEAPSDVPDSTSNKLVVMPPEKTFGPSGQADTHASILDILNRSGLTHRTRRNTLIFIIGDSNEITLLKDKIRGLLATEDVDNNRERHNLSQSQITQLQTEKMTTVKAVRQQLLRTYRHIAWGGINGDPIRTMDMGQPPATGEKNITDLVIAFLKEKQKYLEQIASILIVHPTKLQVWPEDEQTLSLKSLPGYFRNFTHLPILRDEDVLKQAVVDGVRSGHFALCEGTSMENAKVLHYKTAISPAAVSLDEGYLLIRQDLAEEKIAEEKKRQGGETPIPPIDVGDSQGEINQPPVTTEPATSEGETTTGGGGEDSNNQKTTKISLDVEVPFTDFHTFHTGIINALGRNADSIQVRVNIQASSESGFSPTLIEDTIRETLFSLFGNDDGLKVD